MTNLEKSLIRASLANVKLVKGLVEKQKESAIFIKKQLGLPVSKDEYDLDMEHEDDYDRVDLWSDERAHNMLCDAIFSENIEKAYKNAHKDMPHGELEGELDDIFNKIYNEYSRNYDADGLIEYLEGLGF